MSRRMVGKPPATSGGSAAPVERDALASSAATAAQYVPAGIAVTGSTFRSASVERDDAAVVDSYVLTEPALDLLRRITVRVTAGRAGAWSITGAYGTGKSSFAVVLAALLAPDTPAEQTGQMTVALGSHHRALELLSATDPDLAQTLRDAVSARPMLRALVTARREPIGRTVTRALRAASSRHWGRRIPRNVARALTALGPSVPGSAVSDDSGAVPDAAAVLHAVRTMATAAPLLLVIDEFGKNLEHFAGHAEDASTGEDLYLLQELAELASDARAGGPAVYLLSLQHASFLDYAAHTEALQRREWSKIQGRFQDVAFAAGPGDAAALIAGALDQSHLLADDAAALRAYGTVAADRAIELGLDAVTVTAPDVLRRCYPLHPMTIAALPLLAGALGQHDRTLAGFVAGDEPHGVVRFLASSANHPAASDTPAPSPGLKVPTTLRTLQLPELWDYFATAVRGPALASSSASRWIEIETRLSEAHGLPELDARILKCVAVLNLIDSSGCLRAGRANIVFALIDPQRYADELSALAASVSDRLEGLVERGFLTYRAFSDEYRLWHGSTIDLPSRLQVARDELADHDVAALIQRGYAPAAIVAGRHSQETGLLRHFQARVSDGVGGAVDTVPVLGPADGTIVFHLGRADTVPDLEVARPVLVGISPDAEGVVDSGREVAVLDTVLDTEDLDAPARTELQERLSVARSDLAAALAAAFRPDRPDVSWQLRLPDSAGDVARASESTDVARTRSLSALVSAACDRAYPLSPRIRNEMLGRHQLTSQGAKARRELLAALLEQPDTERAGIAGHGPDRAMYDGVVGVLNLHGPTNTSPSGYGWTVPLPGHAAYPAWSEAIKVLRSAYTPITVEAFYLRLGAPPFGVKAGVLPVLLLAALVHTADDVAIFEDGSFVARLSGDLVERMVKTPQRFALRFAPAGRGRRRAFLERLHESLLPVDRPTGARGRGTRNSSMVKVAIALLDVVRQLSPYAKNTAALPVPARAVRDALSTTRDPADLLFTALPEAVGHSAIDTSEPAETTGTEELVADVLAAVDDLRSADRRLAEWVSECLAKAFDVPGELATLRRDLAARARVIRGGLVDPYLASFLAHAQREDIPDDDWLDAAVLIIARTPLASWRDTDAQAFPDHARQLARIFDRVYGLYFDSTRSTGEPFHARRITLTRPDGAEHHVVVGLPDTSSPALVSLVDDFLTKSEHLHGVPGADRGHALLAALAERLLDPGTSGTGLAGPSAIARPIQPASGGTDEAPATATPTR